MMRSNGYKSGFATVFLIMILGSLCLLLMVLVEASCGYALKSEAGAYMDVTGRSVLAEYDRALFDQYGIFALQMPDSLLQEKTSAYLKYDTEGSTGITSMKLKEVSVSGDLYPGLNYELLEKQLVKLGRQIALYSLLTEENASETCSRLFSLTEDADKLKENSLQGLDEYMESLRSEDSRQEEGAPASEPAGVSKVRELKKQYREAMNPVFGKAEKGVRLSSLCKLSELPSRLLNLDRKQSPNLSSLSVNEDGFFTDAYLLFVCSNTTTKKYGRLYPSEAEYILFGNDLSSTNETEAKRLLFNTRFAVQLAAVYADATVLSEIRTAALAFAPVPQSLASFILACCKASAEAAEDVNRLLVGEKLPLLPPALRSGGKSVSMSYTDYLSMFLLCLSQKTKIVRFMDLAQCSLSRTNKYFSFRNCVYGVSIHASFTHKTVPFLSAFFPDRTGICERSYGFQ